MDPVKLLCEFIAQEAIVAARLYRDDAGYGALLDAGLILREGVVRTVLCDDCDIPHEAPVEYENGTEGYYCPDLGFMPLERAEIVAIRPDLESLVVQLGAALGCDLGGAAQLGPRTWRIGLVDTPGGRAAVYLHPRLLSGDDLDALETALRKELRRDYVLILTACGSLPYRDAVTLNLAQMVKLNVSPTRLTPIASVADAVGSPPKPTGGRPSEYGHLLKALIEERIRSGAAHGTINAEALGVRAAFEAAYPDKPLPSDSTIKRYIREAQGGS